MAVEVQDLQTADNTPTVTLGQRTYLDAEGKAVADGDETRAELFGLEGDEVTAAAAEAAGIPDGKLGGKAKPAAKKPAARKQSKPAANKKATPARNKSRKPAAKK